ncbi:hypothetical protein GGR50DRAFT_493699 [Xylaria sp. CBS 124048]|nr:hypothetical protein GGR50DRAFT_493699 [Xylaria sp. CBS 124048]
MTRTLKEIRVVFVLAFFLLSFLFFPFLSFLFLLFFFFFFFFFFFSHFYMSCMELPQKIFLFRFYGVSPSIVFFFLFTSLVHDVFSLSLSLSRRALVTLELIYSDINPWGN